MGTVVTTDVVAGTIIDPATFNANMTSIKDQVNGNLDNTNIKTGANIDVAKLSPGSTGQVLSMVSGVPAWAASTGGGGGGPTSMPVGVGMDFWGAAAPSGWLFADGSAVSRTTYSALFAIVGTTYGSGDGSTTFNLPDKRGRVSVGKGTHDDVNAVGDKRNGSFIDSRTPKHKHTIEDPGHRHPFRASQGGFNWGVDAGGAGVLDTFGTGGEAVTGITVGPQSNTPTDGPAYLVSNYIIYTGV